MADFADVVAEIKKTNSKLDKLTQATDPKGAAAAEDKKEAAAAAKRSEGYLKTIANAVGGPSAAGKKKDEEGKKAGGIFAGVAGALAGLGRGLGAGIGGFGAGLAATMGFPLIAGGFVIAMTALGTGLAAFVAALGVGAMAVSKMMPTIAEGLKEFDGIDGKNLSEVGKGMQQLGLGLGAQGLGGAFAGVGGLVEAIADGIGGLFGLEPSKDRLIDNLKEFSEIKIDGAQVAINAQAMIDYGAAMAVGAGGTTLAAVAGLGTGVVEKFSKAIGAVPLLDKLKLFAAETIDKEAIKNNSEAMAAYAMAMLKGIGAEGAGLLGGLVNIAGTIADAISAAIPGGQGILDSHITALKAMSAASGDIKPENVKNVSKAMSWYALAMLTGTAATVLKAPGAIFNVVNNIADAVAKVIGGDVLTNQLDALTQMSKASEDIDATKVENVANAMVSYAKAMALGAGAEGASLLTGVANFVGNVVEGIGAFFGIAGADPIGDLKKFALVEITPEEVAKIERNATALEAYAGAMATMGSMTVKATLGETITNIMKGIGSLFGKGPDDPMENLRDFAGLDIDGEAIKADVSSLLSILEDPNVDVQKSSDFKTILTEVGDALQAFSISTFIGGLAAVGTSLLSFLRGNESPIQEMMNIANKADDLEKGADALNRISDSLSKIGNLKFSGDNIKIKDFAMDLLQAVPIIEGAIIGGTVDPKGWGNKVKLKGLRNDIGYPEAAANIELLLSAFGISGSAGNSGVDDFGGVGGPRQGGGTIKAGKAYMVGEGGPEMIIPNAAGRVLNAQRTAQMQQASLRNSVGAGGGQAVINNMPVSNISTNQSNTTVTATPLLHPSPIINMVNSAT